ncbi:DUF1569 domain-containing protein [Ralstonia pseudosolanacearum]|uniref:DUF1569 domain-containing protein n=1 Tax=Ralstonia pseudosolanacearum TaxID=1310165 RepID=UPI0018A437B0|nr:DUF1569 domain-containing protein [Ralstonia pseudosolanacearum]BCI56291.1 hypothetical protein 18 [Ralstonia solanacearum]BCI56364.1 hypothetical protein 15 [Ralstonia solanacearum]BCL95161.1 hypothetical protein MAFF211479_48630 [Ralstonia solanacearum]BCM00265.1 hypothetical protein MAFF211491_47180 [Ralstonia solanacearum]BCM15761.1 hypothetical protein MAFF241648_49510 [Ralstonia solanacearum]
MSHIDLHRDRRSSPLIDVERRSVLIGAALFAVAADFVCANEAATWRSLSDVDATLARLASYPPSVNSDRSNSGWSHRWGAMLVHLAQSIEYSMHGFPESKSALFQKTVGAIAFAFFNARGRMSHDLNAPIPGAPDIDPTTPAEVAITRLRTAMASFQSWSAPLQPHFAYGTLSKEEYERAHVMHIAEHFQALGIGGF